MFMILLLPLFVQANSKIISADVYKSEETLYANVSAFVEIKNAMVESLKNGIDLTFSYHFVIQPNSWTDFRRSIEIKKNYLVSYNQTIKKFIIKNPVTFESDAFSDINGIIEHMQSLTDFPLSGDNQLSGNNMEIKVRFELDKSRLPTFMRLENLFDDEWDINSEWIEWRIP